MDSEPASADARSAYASWISAGCPDSGGPRAAALIHALIAELLSTLQPTPTALPEASDDAWLDERLLASVPFVPEPLTVPLLDALEWHRGFPETAAALAQRVVDLATDTDALLALLDDHRLFPCHRLAAEALMTRDAPSARALIERGALLPRDVATAALAAADPASIYALLVEPDAGQLHDLCWYDVVVGVPGALRDPRWLDVAPGLPDRGYALYVAMARDPRNEYGEQAVAMLSEHLSQATDPFDVNRVIFALGETGHPAATPALLAVFHHDIPRVCSALAKCGDERALPFLEERLHGHEVAFVKYAIDHIRERENEIHPSILLAACKDPDPAVADLARRARAGDIDAATVLEDALRERRSTARTR